MKTKPFAIIALESGSVKGLESLRWRNKFAEF